MTSINTALASLVSTASTQTSSSSIAPANTDANDAFGPATNLTLSPEAQAALSNGKNNASASTGANDNTQSTQSNSSAAPAKKAGGAHAGGAPVTTSTSSTETAELVAAAKQQVTAKAGAVAASEVVDSQGNIATNELNRILAQQAAQEQAQHVSINS